MQVSVDKGIQTWRLREFRGSGYDKGRSVLVQVLWFAVMNLIFVKWWLPPRVRPVMLRAFGAEVGSRVLIRHRVRIQWPWKLVVSDDCWIGEEVWLLNLERIVIERDVCISQGALLCTGSHNYRSASFEFDNAPILVEASAWVGARSTILRGVTVGTGAIIGAGVVVRKTVPARTIIVPGS